jgi:hypothetical protein
MKHVEHGLTIRRNRPPARVSTNMTKVEHRKTELILACSGGFGMLFLFHQSERLTQQEEFIKYFV